MDREVSRSLLVLRRSAVCRCVEERSAHDLQPLDQSPVGRKLPAQPDLEIYSTHNRRPEHLVRPIMPSEQQYIL